MKPQSLSPAFPVDGTMGQTGICQMIANAQKLAKAYSQNRPFPHIQLKNMWDDEHLSKVADECQNFNDWDVEKHFFGSVGKRSCSTFSKLPVHTASLINFCHSADFLEDLEELTGEVGLIPDPYLHGGGIHSTVNKGFLKMHVDFDWHVRLNLRRRLNLLVYLNRGWQTNWGGALRLQSKLKDGSCKKIEIMPDFNKTVIFTTDSESVHGHPDPMNLPENRSRNSIALYYYVAESSEVANSQKRKMTQYFFNDGSPIPLKVK